MPGSNGSSRADVFGCVALFETGESLDLHQTEHTAPYNDPSWGLIAWYGVFTEGGHTQ